MNKTLMHLVYLNIISSIIIAVNVNEIKAQDTLSFKMNEITVTTSRTSELISDTKRSLEIITAKELKELPVDNLVDALQYIAGVDLRQRGLDGVQADVNIRGGSFEQTLILINGIRFSDPQTGHHNLNLPINIEDIDRIEILKGNASKSFGPQALSGAINFITKSVGKNNLKLTIGGGENGFFSGSIYSRYNLGAFVSSISAKRNKSDGYIHNTNFETNAFSTNNSLNLNNFSANLFAGLINKKFGANSFYSSRFPNQWEKTRTFISGLNLTYTFKHGFINSKLSLRKNNDEFLLDYERPGFYKNTHETNSLNGIIQFSYFSSFGTSSIGVDFSNNQIESSNLGNHSRDGKGFFLEHKFTAINNLNVLLAAFAYEYSGIGLKLWPGIDLSYKVLSSISLFGSAGKAFRQPSFTDLYYSDPATEGNENLNYEEVNNYEIGIKYNSNQWKSGLSYFFKNMQNSIDWVYNTSTNKWHAKNISNLNLSGFDFSINWMPATLSTLNFLSFNYTYLNSSQPLGNINSRYVREYLRNQFVGIISFSIFNLINIETTARYEDRIEMENFTLFDLKLKTEFKNIEFGISANNLFNRSYQDISGLTLPGRWFKVSSSLNIF